MKILKILTYLYLLLKPYYLWGSGSLQISDIFMVFAFIVFLIINKKLDIKKILNNNLHFLIFLVFVVLINGTWFLISRDSRMVLCTMFYIYNFFLILIFDYLKDDDSYLKNVKNILIINLILQLFFYFLGIGDFEYGTRYKGTFNDPNQFAFYCMVSTFIIYVINNILKCNNNKFIYIITLILIVMSTSTGMLAGYLIFLIFYLIFKIRKINVIRRRTVSKVFFLILAFLILFYFLSFFNIISIKEIKTKISSSDMISRVQEKLGKVNSNNDSNLLYDRGYDKILKHPFYIFIGAGEGAFDRFSDCVQNEIHATFPSLLFYYGIIPMYFLIIWIFYKIRNIPISIYCVYFALFIESFTLINQRQSFFWIIIILGNRMALSNFKKKGKV